MKLLTLNFLTCAVKRCKDRSLATTTPAPPSHSQSSHQDQSTSISQTQPPISEPLPSMDQTLSPQPPSESASPDPSDASPFPLHIKDATLSRTEVAFNATFLKSISSRIDWPAMKCIVEEIGLTLPAGLGEINGDDLLESATAATTSAGAMDIDEDARASAKPKDATAGGGGEEAGQELTEFEAPPEQDLSEEALRKLHDILIETEIDSGFLVCAACEHQYAIKEGIANFLLPPHLV